MSTAVETPSPSLASPAQPTSTRGCAVSIYSSRETVEVLMQTVLHALRAAAGLDATVDVVVNGPGDLAPRLAAQADLLGPLPGGARLRVWHLALGDKAFAWNEYVHRIAPSADVYVFVDGYVRVDPQAFGRLVQSLRGRPSALAATALPRAGMSARRVAARLRHEGGLHGNLYALSACALSELRRIDWRLPLGLYRTDSTLAAALSFGLNIHERDWRPLERIVVDDDAGWDLTPLAWWRPADLRTWYRRRQRQGQGTLENAAVRDHYGRRRVPFQRLPATAAELVEAWMSAAPDDAARLLARDRWARRALPSLRRPRDWSLREQPPECLLDQTGNAAAVAGVGH